MKDWKLMVGVIAGVQAGIAGARWWDVDARAATAAFLVSTVAFCLAAMSYSTSRGHSRWWGLVGCFGLLGFLLLAFQRDRHQHGRAIDGWPEDLSPTAPPPG